MAFVDLQENGDGVSRRWSAGFVTFAAAGVLILAGAVLLPEYAALATLRAGRNGLAHQVRCEEKLAAYNDRMIRAAQDDPVLIARLMIRHGNYRPAGCETTEVESALPDRPVPQRLLTEAQNPPAPDDRLLVRAGLWMADPVTSRSMIVLALMMLAVGVFLSKPASLEVSE